MLISRLLINELVKNDINVIIYEYYDLSTYSDQVPIADVVRYIVGNENIFKKIKIIIPHLAVFDGNTMTEKLQHFFTELGQHLHNSILTRDDLSIHNDTSTHEGALTPENMSTPVDQDLYIKIDIAIIKEIEHNLMLTSNEIMFYGYIDNIRPYMLLGINLLYIDTMNNMGLQYDDLIGISCESNSVFYNFTNDTNYSCIHIYDELSYTDNCIIVRDENIPLPEELIGCLKAPMDKANNHVIVLSNSEEKRVENVIYRNNRRS